MRSRIASLGRDERGVSLIMIALAMTLLLGAAAVAVDLASLRYDIRADRLATDAAVTAGASAIEPFSGSNAEEGCQMAWEYLLSNLEDEGPATPPNCATFATPCVDNSVRMAPASAPPYSVEIFHPVPENHELMGTQALNVDIDGVSCQRLGMRLTRTRDFTFAAPLGFNSGSTEVRSVARIRPDVGEGDVVPLVVLEPYDCDALTADGQGKITVTHFMDSPGIIATDSAGSGDCGASKPYIIDVQAVGNRRWIRAIPVPGVGGAKSAILSYALSNLPGTDPSRAYNPADLTTSIDSSLVDPTDPPDSHFQLYPEPIFRSQRVTRSPIDHRYNCQLSYPVYLGITIRPCTGPTATHIDDHVNAYGDPADVPPPGLFTRWTDIDADGDCQVGSSEIYDVSGDVWVDCSPRLVVNGGTLRFLDGNVVFDGDLDLRSSGVFEMNPSGGADRWAFFREGGDILKVAQASIAFNRTFVLLQDGFINLVGGDGGLVWTAPTDETYRFEDLALWSESTAAHELGGQAGNDLTGTFFTPYADPFVLKGQAGQLQTSAQFLTRKLEVTGFTEVRMEPDPESQTLIPIRGVALIR
ncbi:MAG TPA: hypothetical protein VMP13_07160 [Acidimicrobiia bacterium]|nr:hypothetical protein [Acidimicrobiia bacterium]